MTKWHPQRQACIRCGWCGELVDYPGAGYYLRHRSRWDHWFSIRKSFLARIVTWCGLRPLVIYNAERIYTGRR